MLMIGLHICSFLIQSGPQAQNRSLSLMQNSIAYLLTLITRCLLDNYRCILPLCLVQCKLKNSLGQSFRSYQNFLLFSPCYTAILSTEYPFKGKGTKPHLEIMPLTRLILKSNPWLSADFEDSFCYQDYFFDSQC